MRVFVSSVIGEFEQYRRAATEAAQALDHEVVRAEEFSASPHSPRVACLAGVRSADVVLVILGERYGDIQPSGKSATHEEFDEATRNKQVFVFVQAGVTPDERQARLIAEAQGWATGYFTSRFTDADDLRTKVTTALHRWQLANAAGPVDGDQLGDLALAGLPDDDRYSSSGPPCIAISVVGAPAQSILRPTEIEDPKLWRALSQRALYGEPSIFDTQKGVDTGINEHTLTLRQDRGGYVTLSEEGSLLIVLPLERSDRGLDAMIEEEVREKLGNALQFASQVLHSIDSGERLSSIAVVAAIINPGHGEWRTRAQHDRNRDRMQMSRMSDETPVRAVLSPPHRSRASFRLEWEAMAEDFTALLRRFFQR
jgi:hypothetical protein